MVELFFETATCEGAHGVELLSVTLTDNRGADGTVEIAAKLLKLDTGKVFVDTYAMGVTPRGIADNSNRLNWVSLEPVA